MWLPLTLHPGGCVAQPDQRNPQLRVQEEKKGRLDVGIAPTPESCSAVLTPLITDEVDFL